MWRVTYYSRESIRKSITMIKGGRKIFSLKRIIGVITLITLLFFSDFIAGDKAILCVCKGNMTMPVFSENVRSQETDNCSFCLFPPIRYSPFQIDVNNGNYVSPFAQQNIPSVCFRHWLGTDKLGRDVAAGIVHGAGISLGIGLFATFLSLLLGVPLGIALGYYQDNTIRWNVIQYFVFIVSVFFVLFYISFLISSTSLVILTFACLIFMLILYLLIRSIGKWNMTKYNVPFDLFGFRILEWRKSIPALFLLLALLSLFSKPSVYNVIIIIALLSWADIARLIRAETLTIKNHLFVQSAITMGFSHVYIIVHHIFPMLKGSLIVIAMYIMAGAVLMEATLSFLGLGLPVEEVSWGKLLAESRNARAWWMAVFPGGCLIMLLLFLHSKTKKISGLY